MVWITSVSSNFTSIVPKPVVEIRCRDHFTEIRYQELEWVEHQKRISTEQRFQIMDHAWKAQLSCISSIISSCCPYCFLFSCLLLLSDPLQLFIPQLTSHVYYYALYGTINSVVTRIGEQLNRQLTTLCKWSQRASRSGVVHRLTHLDKPWVVVVYWGAKAKLSIVKESWVLIYKKECSTMKQELK